jgi:penicillin-binding protein 1B
MALFAGRRKRILKYTLALVGVLFVTGALFVVYLDRIVTPQFEGRRWTLPARVYAQPLELYVGMPMGAQAIEDELERIHYRKVTSQLQRPGTYRRSGSRIDLASRRVRFADEVRQPQTLSVVTDAREIVSLRDANGEDVPVFRLDPLLIGSIFPMHGEDRIVIPPEEVPQLLTAALIVSEDRRFMSHGGVDLEAIMRAAWVNLRAGRIEQGGSTLTQQLVKSYFLDDRQTMWRKFKEAVMAMILEARFEKDDLLNAYVNEIYLGQDGSRAVHGFGLASRFYFGKPLGELDLSEIALLVAIVRGPSYYDPRRSPQRARQRRDLVLRLMSDFKVVPKEEAQLAMREPLSITGEQTEGYYPAYLDFVRRTLRRDYEDEDLTEAGLQIHTTLDPRVQALAEKSLLQELERLDRVRKEKGDPLEGSVVVTEPQSGDVIAIVGGRRAGFHGFNRALDSKRSIGSLAKPVVYLAALESGRYTAASVIPDEPIEVRLSRDKVWKPVNFGKEWAGPVPLVRALAESLNLATVHLGLEVGLPRITRTFERLGLEEQPARNPSLILGGIDLSPLQVTQLYNSLANGGFRTPLRAVRAVVNADGTALKAFPVEVTPAAEPDAVHQLNRMLVLAMDHGTGQSARAQLPAQTVVAGKTGTSSDFRDSWFAGFSASHLAVVWVGYDDNRPTGLTGSAGALSVWSNLMRRIATTPLDVGFLPDTLEDRTIEFQTGLAARPACGEDVVLVAVPRGAELPSRPGCGESVLRDFADRAREWWEGVTR